MSVSYNDASSVSEETIPEEELFDVNIPIENYNMVVSPFATVAIRCEHKCNCYQHPHNLGEYTRPTEYYYCRKPLHDNTNITIRDVVEVLRRERYDPGCSHNQLDGFLISDSGAEVCPVFRY